MSRHQRTAIRFAGWAIAWTVLAAWAIGLTIIEEYGTATLVVILSGAPAIWAGQAWDRMT